jgi:hypothetical protein
MKTAEKRATVETAYGKKLDTPLTFDYTYDELEKGDEIPAKEMPDADDLITYVNAKRNASARSTAQTKILDANEIKKPDLKDAAFRLASMVKVLMANGDDEETATATAKTLLKM